MRLLIALTMMLFSVPAIAAEWSSGAAPGDAPGTRVAWIQNNEGHVLILRGVPDGTRYWVFVEFRLGGGQKLSGDIPSHMFRPGYEIENDWQLDYEKYGKEWGAISDTTASWVLSSFARYEYVAGEVSVLDGWFESTDVAIVYETDGGVSETTRFPLAGAKAAFVAATDLTIGD